VLGFACVVLLVLPAVLKLAAVLFSPELQLSAERQLPIAEDSGPYCQGLLLLCRKVQVSV
jgi:hypothetical protein